MTRAVCLGLVAVLGLTTAPALAQARRDVHPIAVAIARAAYAPGAASSLPTGRPGGWPGGSRTSDWSRVHKLERGDRLVVVIRDAPAGNYLFLNSDESSVTLLADSGEPMIVPRDRIVSIWTQPRKHVGRHVRRGALIGMIAGATIMTIGTVAECRQGHSDYCGVALPVMGAGAGATYGLGIGALIGLASPRSVDVIYRAPA